MTAKNTAQVTIQLSPDLKKALQNFDRRLEALEKRFDELGEPTQAPQKQIETAVQILRERLDELERGAR
jgi:chaperonin cofactor prefoldin